MSETITTRQFRESPGVEDWRMVFGGASVCYRTGSFERGAALVAAISSTAADLETDVDLRPGTVTVRFPEWIGYTTDHIEIARLISAAATELGLAADPSVVQGVQLALDAMVHADVIPFWSAVLGYDVMGDEDVLDPLRRGPSIWFQQMDEPRPQRNRFHVDVCLPVEFVQARVAATLAAGGRVVNDKGAPQWWTLADSEGNEVDVTSWEGRD